MRLTVDIGNTNINLGVFSKGKLLRRLSFPTGANSYALKIRKIFKGYPINNVIICSVVPQATRKLKMVLRSYPGSLPVVGRNTRVPIKNLYRNPKQVGSDRLVNAYAAIKLYGAPAVVVDFGTAVTFDVVSRKGEYLGGMILPGLRIALEALAEKTALLPKTKLSPPKELIGRDSQSSMLSGIIYGMASLTRGLCARIRRQVGAKALVIGTGGNIKLMARYCRIFKRVDPDLTLKGLNLLLSEKEGEGQ
ncbi:MAG: type III pantothenate kinase [Candidatus Omnitrophota bacterium]